MTFPIRFDPGFRPDRTSLISRIVEVWGEIPSAVLQQLCLRQMRYGFVGLEDYTMYPLIRPGAFVQIDDKKRRISEGSRGSEHERPIYFLELRDGYICAWCELHQDRLIAVPHPLSPCRVRSYSYPNEVEIVGQVTALATRLVEGPAAVEARRDPRSSGGSLNPVPPARSSQDFQRNSDIGAE